MRKRLTYCVERGVIPLTDRNLNCPIGNSRGSLQPMPACLVFSAELGHSYRSGEWGGFFLSLCLFNLKTIIVPARRTMTAMTMNFSILFFFYKNSNEPVNFNCASAKFDFLSELQLYEKIYRVPVCHYDHYWLHKAKKCIGHTDRFWFKGWCGKRNERRSLWY